VLVGLIKLVSLFSGSSLSESLLYPLVAFSKMKYLPGVIFAIFAIVIVSIGVEGKTILDEGLTPEEIQSFAHRHISLAWVRIRILIAVEMRLISELIGLISFQLLELT
jgi:hypothetical protein